MDINQTLSGLVDTLSKQILDEVSARVDANLKSEIDKRLTDLDIAARVDVAAKSEAKVAAAQYQPDFKSIDKQLEAAAGAIITNITGTADKLVKDAINSKIASIDFQNVIVASTTKMLADKLDTYNFPGRSIPSTAINFSSTLSGDIIQGGVIKEFSSTGIEDKSSSIQVTILDDYTVVENQLLAKDFTVKGKVNLDGDISLNGTIAVDSPGFAKIIEESSAKLKEDLNDEFFADFGRLVFKQIQDEGIDLSKVTLNGEVILQDKRLASGIVGSNLQELGVLKELQVSGESLLHNTLFVTGRRVGINTLEPSSALTLWDDEVEINIGKHKQGVAMIGTTRTQAIMLTANGKNNLLLNPDGSITASKIHMGNMNFGTSPSAPTFDAPKGTVLFNENPSVGGPLGWVSLGSARWANFGIID